LAPVEVRRVHADEHDRAGRLVVAAYCALPGGRLSEGYAAALADLKGRSADAEVLVAVEGEDLLGCVTFVPDASSRWAEGLEDGEASIRMLGVDPLFQGRGAGSALVDACIDRARAIGRGAIFLHSTPAMGAAHRLYLRAGFVRLPERDWAPVDPVQLLAFRLDL
jgi:ribosomal protein S18 acetylase RimI-like enzyme